MAEYRPDVWEVVKVTFSGESHYRVLAGWYGGFAGSDSWKFSSAINKIVRHGDVYHFHNESGSTYICHIGYKRFSGLTYSIYKNSVETCKPCDSIELVEDIDSLDLLVKNETS